MRDIDMGSLPTNVLPTNTFLIYGDSKTGKTTFAGTAPRPLFLSDGSEHGYESLRDENWDNNETPRFEEDVRPIVWTLDQESDFAAAVERARPLVEAGVVKSIWADSITFFADLIFNSILMGQTGKRDTRAAYGELGVRLRNIRIKLASLGVTVGWLAHAKHPSEDDPAGGPMIPGQQATKFAGGTDYVWYSRLNQPAPMQPGTFDIHTKKFGPYIAGHRLGIRGAQLLSPFRGNYAGFLESIGYDIPAIRAGLPPIDKARARAKELAVLAAKAAAPPIAAGTPAAKPPVVIKPTTVVNNGKTVAPTAKQ